MNCRIAVEQLKKEDGEQQDIPNLAEDLMINGMASEKVMQETAMVESSSASAIPQEQDDTIQSIPIAPFQGNAGRRLIREAGKGIGGRTGALACCYIPAVNEFPVMIRVEVCGQIMDVWL